MKVSNKGVEIVVYHYVKQLMTMNKPIVDRFYNTIAAGQAFFTGQFLEWTTSQTIYVLSNKKTYFFKERVVYRFVHVIPNEKGFIITNDELCEVLAYVEKTGMSRIWECVS